MKNLAQCKPSEFLVQTNKIRKAVEKWITLTDLHNIRKTLPTPEPVAKDATAEEKAEAIKRNKQRLEEQARKNLSRFLDAALEEHPAETLEILALCCFVEPEHVDDYPISEYLKAINAIINDEAVIGFFTSLANLGNSGISTV